ncbi:MAG: hypothetical protein WCO56_16095 [Verrucomicrobiota bacterium]
MPNATNISPVPAAPQAYDSAVLRGKLASVRARHVSVTLGLGIAWLVSVGLVVVATAMLCDWWFDFPLWLRALLLLGYLGALGWHLFQKIIQPYLRRPDDEGMALMIERGKPEFRSRFISAIQFGRPGGVPPGTSLGLARALVAETEVLAETVNLQAVVPMQPLIKKGRVAAGLLLVALVAFFITREASVDLLRRVLLSGVEVPRKTRVDVLNGDKVIGRGDAVTILLRARGIIPRHGSLLLRHASGHEEEIAIYADKQDPAKFVRVIENVQDDFTYRVKLGDNTTRAFKVRAIARPEVAYLECNQIFPPYTKLGTVRRPLGDLALLAGSQLQLRATASKEVAKGIVKLVGLGKEIAMEVNPKNPREVTGIVPIPDAGLNGVSIYLSDQYGVQTKDPAVYRVDILPDKPPVVQITYPDRKEDLVTRQATVLIGFDASDDYAIAKAFLKYKIDAVDKGTEKSVELDLGAELPRNLRRRYEWKLATLIPPPPEGCIIEYWMEVRDGNDITGPGIGMSDHYVIKVVSESEKRADLMSRVNDYLGGITDVVKDQEKLNETLGALIRSK